MRKQVQEKQAQQMAKRQLEISSTSDTKKDAKKQKNEKETASSESSESESDWEKGKNGQKSLSNYKEILNKAKQDARLIKSRLLKRDSKDAKDAVHKLYGLIADVMA